MLRIILNKCFEQLASLRGHCGKTVLELCYCDKILSTSKTALYNFSLFQPLNSHLLLLYPAFSYSSTSHFSLFPLSSSTRLLCFSLFSSLVLLLPFSPQLGKDLVSQTLSTTITTPPRRPLISPFNSPPRLQPPPPLYPSIYPSIHPSIATIPGLLLSHSWSSSGFPSLPTTQLCVCVGVCVCVLC